MLPFQFTLVSISFIIPCSVQYGHEDLDPLCDYFYCVVYHHSCQHMGSCKILSYDG
jgi:hypothetical protein